MDEGSLPTSRGCRSCSARASASLNFVAGQCERLLAEVAALRHDIAVLTALTRRLEYTQAAVLKATGVQARDGDSE
jgi:hypothetical protein